MIPNLKTRKTLISTIVFLFLIIWLVYPNTTTDKTLVPEILPKYIDRWCRGIIFELKEEKVDKVVKYFTLDENDYNTREQVRNIIWKVNKEKPLSINLIHARFRRLLEKGASTYYHFMYHIEYLDSSETIRFEVEETADQKAFVKSLNLNTFNEPLKKTHAFSFREKSLKHYVFLLLTLLYPICVFITFLVCINAEGFKKKWVYAILCLVGFVNFTCTWTTGDISIQPLNIGLNLIGIGRLNVYTSWVLFFLLATRCCYFLDQIFNIRFPGVGKWRISGNRR